MSVALSQPPLPSQRSPSFGDGRKFSEVEQAVLWTILQQDPHCTSPDLLSKAAQHQMWPRVTLRQINRWRAKWQLSRGKGRPLRADVSINSERAVVCVTPRLSFVGVHLFARWLDQQEAFAPVVAELKEAIREHQSTHPDEDFALLHHRDATLGRRFQALLLAPLLGMERLSAFDTQEHPLETLIGGSYHYTTLRQFLGQLERVNAGPSLMPCLLPAQGACLVYVDGHMIAYWSRKAMHKGKITMRGRIMAGSQAVISHDETGQAVYAAYYPPDMHLSQVILAYCEQVALATGSDLFVIDRAVNAKAMAQTFDEAGLGFLCMLDTNAGRKTLLGPDRHQQRAEAQVRASLETAQGRVEKKSQALEAKREQVAESEAKRHGTRLEQRQRAAAALEHERSEAQQHEARLQEQVSAFDAPKERADRDFRQQTIMTIRTLFLENLLGAFMGALLAVLPQKVSLEQVLKLLFERSGSRIERDQEIMYWVNTTGLSRAKRRVLDDIVEGLSAMGLMERGKIVRVCLKELPP